MRAQDSSETQADTRTYLVVHNAFRLATNRFADATEKLEPAQLQQMMRSHWDFYAAVLHEHHHNEDDSIFPALLAARPDLDALLKRLEDDHRELIRNMAAVDSAISAFDAQPDAAHQKAMHDAIVAVRDAFLPHLDIEDAEILPAIAVSIEPKEWDRMDKAALKAIPRQHLPTAAGAIDEVVQGMAKDEQPPPAPLPIRLMLALSWRKRWSIWVKPLVV